MHIMGIYYIYIIPKGVLVASMDFSTTSTDVIPRNACVVRLIKIQDDLANKLLLRVVIYVEAVHAQGYTGTFLCSVIKVMEIGKLIMPVTTSHRTSCIIVVMTLVDPEECILLRCFLFGHFSCHLVVVICASEKHAKRKALNRRS